MVSSRENMVEHHWLDSKCIQSNLCTTTSLGIQNWRPFLIGGLCLEVAKYYKILKWDPKLMVAVYNRSLLGVDC
jgi:hypothetical protein